jgi:CHASE3 domain sensor protein
MAALQLAHELLGARGTADSTTTAETSRRIRRMTEDLDAEIRRQESLF